MNKFCDRNSSGNEFQEMVRRERTYVGLLAGCEEYTEVHDLLSGDDDVLNIIIIIRINIIMTATVSQEHMSIQYRPSSSSSSSSSSSIMSRVTSTSMDLYLLQLQLHTTCTIHIFRSLSLSVTRISSTSLVKHKFSKPCPRNISYLVRIIFQLR